MFSILIRGNGSSAFQLPKCDPHRAPTGSMNSFGEQISSDLLG